MAPLIGNVGETSGNLPSQLSDAGNDYKYSGRERGIRHIPQDLPVTPIKLRKRGEANTIQHNEGQFHQKTTPDPR
ncbi:unnamed protein product [Protopolystoma xenopodis]|uniref:Uncharacterized protein n=1 Tax=Protopolystoma xenopodis TaxID=117903 RepID=A0A3S5BWN2_9PLAT|nr:unnamed protein product [Protopolystoma xenopodis]